MPSSVIRSFDYDPATRDLHVVFTTGRRYVYFGVPQDVVDAFRSAFSKGIYFNTRIRDHYAYREITREARTARG